MRAVPRLVAVPFLLAVCGVLVMVGLVINRAVGPIALAAYAFIVVAPVVATAVSAVRRRNRLTAGRTCTCCTGTVHDPVQVI